MPSGVMCTRRVVRCSKRVPSPVSSWRIAVDTAAFDMPRLSAACVKLASSGRDNAQLISFVASQTALGRVGLPEDIGGAIASLSGENSGGINGQRVEASGGMLL